MFSRILNMRSNRRNSFFLSKNIVARLTLRRPKQHGSQAPDVPDLAQTVKPWSDLLKIFTSVFAGAKNPK